MQKKKLYSRNKWKLVHTCTNPCIPTTRYNYNKPVGDIRGRCRTFPQSWSTKPGNHELLAKNRVNQKAVNLKRKVKETKERDKWESEKRDKPWANHCCHCRGGSRRVLYSQTLRLDPLLEPLYDQNLKHGNTSVLYTASTLIPSEPETW